MKTRFWSSRRIKGAVLLVAGVTLAVLPTILSLSGLVAAELMLIGAGTGAIGAYLIVRK